MTPDPLPQGRRADGKPSPHQGQSGSPRSNAVPSHQRSSERTGVGAFLKRWTIPIIGALTPTALIVVNISAFIVNNLTQFRNAIDRLKGGQTARIYVTSPGRGGPSVAGYRFIHVP